MAQILQLGNEGGRIEHGSSEGVEKIHRRADFRNDLAVPSYGPERLHFHMIELSAIVTFSRAGDAVAGHTLRSFKRHLILRDSTAYSTAYSTLEALYRVSSQSNHGFHYYSNDCIFWWQDSKVDSCGIDDFMYNGGQSVSSSSRCCQSISKDSGAILALGSDLYT